MSTASEQQNAANHARVVPGYHYLAGTLALLNLIWAIYRSVTHPTVESHAAILVGVILLLLLWYLRVFPLAVQDRLIRLEERLRLARLMPQDMQSRLDEFTAGQLIALRFASDAELPVLATKVLTERVTDRKQIKLLIRDWRADHMRA
ncbi:hypothetical protein BH09GEM1_BH09GEM1_33610 [soil metagenome]